MPTFAISASLTRIKKRANTIYAITEKQTYCVTTVSGFLAVLLVPQTGQRQRQMKRANIYAVKYGATP